MMKNMIYMSIFNNKKYIELLTLLLKSLKKFGKIDNNIEIVILTNEEFHEEIDLICKNLDIKYKINCMNLTSIEESKWSRFMIFDLENADVSEYDKILYLDVDIIIRDDIMKIFDVKLKNKIYARGHGNISGEYYGSELFNEWSKDKNNKLDTKTRAFCSGVMLFNACNEIKELFNDTLKHILEYKNSGKKFGTCIDQPFINFHAIIKDMYDIELLETIVTNNPSINTINESICHFAGDTCNYDVKIIRMSKLYEHINKEIR